LAPDILEISKKCSEEHLGITIFVLWQIYLMSKELLKNHILSRVALDEQELDYLLGHFEKQTLKKKQYIVQPGFVARFRIYVLEGALRSFLFTADGQEFTINFAIADWYISDINSYLFQKPATLFLEALTNSTVLILSYENEVKLKQENHKFESYFRIIAEGGLAHHQRMLISNLTKSAEERNEEFEKKYPLIVQKVPQYAIASYLGMTSEYLSKIRSQRTKPKT
jgi:CRP-like cAMP-binding protein